MGNSSVSLDNDSTRSRNANHHLNQSDNRETGSTNDNSQRQPIGPIYNAQFDSRSIQRPLNSIPKLKKVGNVCIPMIFESKSLELLKDDAGGRFSFQFSLDSDYPGTATIHIVATQLCQPETGESRIAKPDFHLPRFFKSLANYQVNFKVGKAQTLKTEPFFNIGNEISPADLLYHEKSRSFPVVIVLAKDPSFPTEAVINEPRLIYADSLCVYFSLNLSNGSYTAAEFQRAITIDDTIYVIKTLFGCPSDAHKGAADTESQGDECVICFTDLRNTTVLPCMHMCLCEECANSLKSRNSRCPMCRSRITEFWRMPR